MNIFSSKNELSNNYLYPLEIDGKTWKNVSQYIYTNFLLEESNKKILKNNLKKMSEKFNELVASEEEKLVIEGLQTALPVKFSNIELAHKLISTGDANIVYSSNNIILGINKEGEGKNIYGKLLMEVRKTLKRQSNLKFTAMVDSAKKETIYRSYLVKYFIEDILNNFRDFTPYTNMSMEEIYDMATGDFDSNGPIPIKVYNSFQLYKQSIDKLPRDTLLAFVNPEIKMYPGRVVEFVLKQKLRNTQIMAIEKKKNIIYDMYLEHFLDKSNLNNDKVKKLFNSYDKVVQNREKFLNYLETAYYSKKLDSRLQSDISDILEELYIPTEKQIESAESVVFDLNKPIETKVETKTETKNETKSQPKPNGKTVTFIDSIFQPFGTQLQKPSIAEQKCDEKKTLKSEDIRAILDAVMQGEEIPEALLKKQPETSNIIIDSSKQNDIYFELCPISYDMLKIDTNIGISKKIDIKMERWFPTVSHYLMFLNIKKLMGNTSQSYDVLIKNNTNNKFEFHSIDIINNRYKDLMFQKYEYYLHRAIDIKLKDEDIVDALLETGEITLLYNDKNDEILGTGPHKRGGNFTGKYLMEVRSKLMAKNPVQIKTSISPVEKLLMNEDEWVDEKVKDYCNIILNIGTDTQDEVNIKCLDMLFPSVFPQVGNIPTQPKYFINMINTEIPNLNNKLKKYIWQKLVDIGTYLSNMANPHKVLNDASSIVQSDAYVQKFNKNTLIEVAILNIADVIKTIEEESFISNRHLTIATNILLKRSYSVIRDDDFDDLSSDGSDDSVRTAPSTEGEQSEGEQSEGDSPKRKDDIRYTRDRLDELIQEVINYDLPNDIKKGRINYFRRLEIIIPPIRPIEQRPQVPLPIQRPKPPSVPLPIQRPQPSQVPLPIQRPQPPSVPLPIQREQPPLPSDPLQPRHKRPRIRV